MRVRTAALGCLVASWFALAGCGDSGDQAAQDSPRSTAPTEQAAQAPQAEASCVGPYLDDQPPGGTFGAPAPTVWPGDSLEIHGHFYMRTCNDTGGDDPLVALPDVTLTVAFPGGQEVRLGPFTPSGHDLGFTAIVEVPPDAEAGEATVTDDRDVPATYRFRVGGPGAPVPDVVEWDGKGWAPPLTLDLDGRRVDLEPTSACYGKGCFDGMPVPPYVDVGDRDAVAFSFPDPGWEFEATFHSGEYGDCPRAVTVPVRRTSDRTFEITPAGPAGVWLVDLFGRGPEGGDVITTFTWTTASDGALPEAATGSAGVLASLDPGLTSYGVEVYVQDLAERPERASATVTVSSGKGRTVTLKTRWDKQCFTQGSLTFTAPDDAGLRATELGPGPFGYDVALTLDGTTYHGVGEWPTDETEEIAPHVPLTWTPALPAYDG